MVNGEALQLALALHSQPARAAELRARALPAGVTEVLRIASGNASSVASAAQLHGVAPDVLIDAARFYVEQQLLARECERDPWRVLGVSPAADPELIRDHRRLLVGLVHPDRGEDWAAAFSDRVNRAWRELKSPEGRAAALERAAESVRQEAWSAGSDDYAARTGEEGRAGEPSSHETDDAWAPVANPETQSGARPTEVQWPLSRLPGAAQPSPPHRSVSRAATAGGLALVACGLALLVWNLVGTHGLGDEVLVPMADVARPSAGLRSGQPGRNPAMTVGESPAVDRPSSAAVPSAALVPPAISAASRSEAEKRVVGSESNVLVVQPESPAMRTTLGSASPVATSSAPLPAPAVPAAAEPVQTGQLLARRPGGSGAAPAVSVTDGPDERGSGRSDGRDYKIGEPIAASEDAGSPAAGRSAGSDSRLPSAPEGVPVVDTRPSSSRSAGATSEPSLPIAADPDAAAVATLRDSKSTAPGADPLSLPLAKAPVASDQGATDSGSADGAALNAVRPQDLSSDLAADLLHSFSQHYASGDIGSLVGLFSSQANSARGGTMALAADYARLFEDTSDREFSVRDLRWRIDGELLRGEGRFEARYYRKGRLFRQVVKGEISFVMVAENGRTRILRLDSRPDGRRA